MKTSDEHLNEALRAALKRKFDTFEADPEPLALDQVLANLPARKNWKFLLLSVGILLFGITGLWLDQHINFPGSKSAPGVSTNTKVILVNKKRNAIRQKTEPVTVLSKTLMHSYVKKAAVSRSVRRISQQKVANENAQVEVNFILNTDLRKAKERHISYLNPEMLDSKDPAFDSLALPALNAEIFPVIPRVNALEKSKVNWLFNAAVLEGYQILTVPAEAANHYQNFKLPRPLSLQSIGYKLGVGVEKNGFQLRLNYSYFRQRYSYEVAGEEYLVEDLDKSSYQIVRPGERIEFDQQLNWLGIGVSKQVQWGRSAVSRYFATAGVEYLRGLENNRHTGMVNAAFGKQFLLNRKLAAEVGPFMEISPFRIKAVGNPFYSQPYRVGINFGVRLIK